MKKLIVLDIDGTLIDDNFNVSYKTINIIKTLVENGVHVALATGRAIRAADVVRKQVGIDLPIIGHNGSRIRLANGEEIYNEKIPLSIAKNIIQYAEENNLYIKIYVGDMFYVKEDNELTQYYSKTHDLEYIIIDELSRELREEPNMITMIYDFPIDEKEMNKFKDMDINITASTNIGLEFIAKGVTKGAGLKRLAKNLKINRKDILAIGNSLNDLSMLQYAGTGIAMANSDEYLLNRWDNVSKHNNNEEGVYRILKDIVD